MASVTPIRSRNRARAESARESPAFLDDLMAMAGSLANSRKEYAAAQLETLADSMRQLSETLPSMPTVKTYAETAADSMEDLASYVVESDLADMVADAREFARRHPLATFGGSIAAGVIITQLIHARAESMREAVRSRRQRRTSRGSRRSAGTEQGEENAAE